MSNETLFFVPRRTGSPADVLEAFGAAFVLRHLAGAAPEQVRIVGRNGAFEIHIRGASTPLNLMVPLIPYFYANDVDLRPTAKRGEVYDYASDKKRSEEKKAADKQTTGTPGKGRKRPKRPVSEEQEDRAKPSPRWPLYSSLQALTKGAFRGDWNETWKTLDDLSAADAERLAREAWLYLRNEGPVPQMAMPKGDELTLGQHLNPIAAKGSNRAKPDSVKRDNLSGPRFLEWLKMVALDRVGILRRVEDDVRFWIPVPADIGLDTLQAALAKFQETPWRQGNVKRDVFTAIDLADALARYWLERKQPPRRRTNRVVRGVEVVYFKDMGGGFNVMNVTSYGLPGWIVLQDDHDLESYLAALDAFRHAAQCLDESHSDDIPVLAALREAIGAEDAKPLLAFLTDYAVFAQRTLASPTGHARRFTIGVLDAVLGGVEEMLTEIVKDDGFRQIATAIRKATVSGQWNRRKEKLHQGPKHLFEIHYGLFSELRRAARQRNGFVARLADFVTAYNAESARMAEANPELPPRARVGEGDLDAVMRLIQVHGSELVGQLLCAYGSATEEREPGDPQRQDATISTPSSAQENP